MLHIIYSGLGGHFDYVFNLLSAMPSNRQNEILFFGVEDVPAYYLEKCKQSNISVTVVIKRGSGARAALEIIKCLRNKRPDLIYVHSNAAVLPVRLYRFLNSCKLVLVEHHNNQLKTLKDHRRSRLAQRHFDRIIFLTQAHYNDCRLLLKTNFDEKKSVVIQTGIPATSFRQPVVNSTNAFVLGMQSRLVPIKDHDTLIRAFSKLIKKFPNAQLRIAGDGIERERLELLCGELGIQGRVQFAGMLSKNDLRKWLTELGIYIHATLGETSSIALMEALAAGLPVVASNVTGIREFLDERTAVLVPPKNVEMLEAAITGLLMDQEKRRLLAENAYNFAKENCSLEKMVASYSQLETQLRKSND